MSLRATAAADLLTILNDPESGGDSVTITSPIGTSETFMTLSNDIQLSFDPSTGEQVTGRQATVAVAISELITVGFQAIAGVADSTSKPWVVDAVDVNGVAGKFKVAESAPDNGAGLMVLILEVYTQ
jgi:hypothetical protein